MSVCPYLHGRPGFGPSCTEFVYPGCWHFDIGETSKIDDVLIEHDGLPYVVVAYSTLVSALGPLGLSTNWDLVWFGPRGFGD